MIDLFTIQRNFLRRYQLAGYFFAGMFILIWLFASWLSLNAINAAKQLKKDGVVASVFVVSKYQFVRDSGVDYVLMGVFQDAQGIERKAQLSCSQFDCSKINKGNTVTIVYDPKNVDHNYLGDHVPEKHIQNQFFGFYCVLGMAVLFVFLGWQDIRITRRLTDRGVA